MKTSNGDIHRIAVKAVSAMLTGILAAGCLAPAPRMDRSKLQIGTYCLATYARTEEQVKAVKDCGIDFIYGIPAADRATLDHCAKYGLGVIATGAVPFWHGSNDRGKMKEQRPLSSYSKAMAEYVDHPAIWMIDYIDESSAVDFPHIGAVTDLLKTEVPAGVGLYANLYPTYASVVGNSSDRTRSQLGTATYDEHVAEFVRLVDLDYLSFDFYLYSAVGAARTAKLADFHRNFRILAEACRVHGKSLWYIPQVNSYLPDMWISENQLRFQANLALAYGAEVINWACWSREEIEEPIETPGLIGWWTNNVLTLTGEKTQQYGKLKKINAELHRLGDRYMAYRNVGTRRVDNDAFVIGDMVARDGSGRKALFVLAAGDPFDERPCKQRFTFAAASARAFGGNGEIPLVRNGDGTFALELDANAGALVEYEEVVEESGIRWIDGRDLPLEGRAFDDTEHYYDRLPANVTTNVNEGVRSMKHHTSGMVFRFKTDSKQLTFKWVPYNSSLEMDHMPSTGVSGIDVYRYDAKADRWRYVKTGRIGSASGATLTVPWEPGTPCLVNLPLYNGIRSFSLGVDRTAQVQALPPRKSGVEKPVVFYGTSITHGGCCSRPGMSFVNILGRTCDVPVVNLGFSGSGRMEYEMSEHLARIDASCYVLDCLWNMKSRAAGDPPGFTVEENFEPFVRNLRAKRPDVPIVIAESSDVYFGKSSRSSHHQAKDRFVRGVYEKLIAEGWKRLYWLPKDEMYSGDFEGTVDGAHPNDAGMLTLAAAYGKAVRAALAESGFIRQTTGKKGGKR